MRYRVRMDVSFDAEADAIEFIDHIKLKKSKIKDAIIPQGLGLDIPKTLEMHQCYHDETPPHPCNNYVQIDWDA